MAIKKSGWEKYWLNPWMAGVVGSAFAAVICFMQINSYWADKNGMNWMWWVLGFVGVGLLGYCGYRLNKSSTGTGG